MSASNLALGISVALNAGLVVLLVAAHRQEAGLSQTGAFREQVAPPAAQQLASSLSPRSEAKRPTSGKRHPGANADTMHADDAATLRAQVAALREAGVPEEAVEAFAVAVADHAFRRRARGMLGLTSSDGKNYWEVSDPRDSLALDAAKLRDFQALRREKYAALAGALGRQYEAPYTADSVGTIVRSRSIDLDYLPPDARLKLLELLERQAYVDQSRRGVMRLATNGPGDHERQVVQRDAEIAALLGPAQFDEYLRRTSDVAGRLRYQLSAFRPTREEFDALLQIERERMIDAGGGAVLQDSVVPRFKTTTEEDRQQRLKAALGESRYAQYV